MNILVTGAFGFIGTSLSNSLLLQEDVYLYFYDNFTSLRPVNKKTMEVLLNARVHLVEEKDILDPESKLWDIIDHVVHLGAIASTDQNISIKDLFESNVFFTRKLIQAIREHQNVKCIYASSAAVYGNSKTGEIIPCNLYGYTKLLNERDFRKVLRGRSIGLRLFNVYGFGEENKGNMISIPRALAIEARNEQTVTIYQVEVGGENRTASRDFISVDMVVCTIISLLRISESWKSDCIDIGSGISTNLLEIALIIKDKYPDTSIIYKPFPGSSEHYQVATKADLTWQNSFGFHFSIENPRSELKTYIINSMNSL